MPARKMRVELFDSDGNRYTIAFEGQVTRDKALRLLDLVELLGGAPGEGPTVNSNAALPNKILSRFEKVQLVIQKNFPLIWFSSKDIQSVYEQELKEPVGSKHNFYIFVKDGCQRHVAKDRRPKQPQV